MGIVDRPVDDEPDERPDQLGRALIRIQREFPGQWREVYETENRSNAVRIEGCLIGRGEGRIAGVTDIAGWDARVVERHYDSGAKTLYAVRVRFTPPKDAKGPSEKLAEVKPPETFDRTAATGAVPETNAPRRPRDPEEAAQAGLDLAAG